MKNCINIRHCINTREQSRWVSNLKLSDFWEFRYLEIIIIVGPDDITENLQLGRDCTPYSFFHLIPSTLHSGLKFKNISNYLPHFKSNQFRLNMAEIQNGAVQNVAEVANAVVGLNAPAAANANVGAGKKNNRSGTTNWNSEDHDAILNSISNMGGNWE